jgi:hypothetical protein
MPGIHEMLYNSINVSLFIYYNIWV